MKKKEKKKLRFMFYLFLFVILSAKRALFLIKQNKWFHLLFV
jgi:hypothetical protein